MKYISIKQTNNIINISICQTNKNIKNKILIDYNQYLNNNKLLIDNINKLTTNNNLIYTLLISNKLLFNDIISIIHKLKNITILNINIKILLDNKYIYKLIECKNIKIIRCYDINTNIYNLIDENKKIFITYNNIYTTKFYKLNNISTNSELYYKNNIIINDECNIDDIEYFLSINNNLSTINIYYNNYKYIKFIVNILLKYNKHDIIINIDINEDNSKILSKSFKYLKLLEKKKCKSKNIDLRSNYSKEYKNKYAIKQLNNIYLKNSLFIISFIILTYYSTSIYYNYQTDRAIKEIQDISNILSNLDDTNIEINKDDNNQETIENSTTNNSSNNSSSSLTEDFNKLIEINSEVVGWLKVKNTKVNYPVVRHSDNDYYLNHNFYNKVNNAGWVFMDYRNEIDDMDQNTIIYGHSNTRGDTMFGSLYKVLDKSWYTNKDNQIINLRTLHENINYQIFAIYITDPEYYYIWTNFFNNTTRFNTFISEVKSKSIYDFGIDVSMSDKILTLSTCYNNGTQRIAIHAKRI